jgi:SAM-dependent methyltransferase
MSAPASRFDPIADWYVEATRDWGPEPLALLPEDLAGQRVLDQACGYGVASRYLAARGARVTGVDLSHRLLTRAREAEAAEPLGVDYIHADATTTAWWDGRPFDGALSNMALMDIEDLDGALRAAFAVLRPGGWFSLSLFHPCFPGGPIGSASGLSSWPPEAGYSAEGWWTTNGTGVRGRVGAYHRMLSTYLNAVLAAGFRLEEFAEPPGPVPLNLIARPRRP